MPRCILKPVEFVTQSHNFRFVACDDIQTDGLNNYSFKKTKPGKAVPQKLSPMGYHFSDDTIKKLRRHFKNNRQYSVTLKEYREMFSRQEYIQEITISHISSNGFYAIDEGPEHWPDRMYLKIPLARTTEEITSFLIKKYSFCYFPYSDDLINLQNYQEDNLYLEKLTPHKGVRAINWLHLYQKIARLTDIIENMKSVTEADRHFLREEIRRNVVEVMVYPDDFAYREIRDFEEWEGKGIENEGQENPVKGYRIFGHFALCCLELLTDIERSHIERFCAYTLCRRPLPHGERGGRKTCDSDCTRLYRNEQARVRRLKNTKN